MRTTTLILTSALLLSACTMTKTKEPVCTGNYLRNCQPVVYFDLGSSVLKTEGKTNLDWAAEKMKTYTKRHVEVTGYADTVGESASNFTLAKERALAVKNYLVKKGISQDRIMVASMGELKPVCTKATCQELNRRAELNIYTPKYEVTPEQLESLKPANWKRPFSEE